LEPGGDFARPCIRQFLITASRDLIDPEDLGVVFCSAPHCFGSDSYSSTLRKHS
jgi:hypothetical protein